MPRGAGPEGRKIYRVKDREYQLEASESRGGNSPKRNHSQMSEEEQLALAFVMSAKEANEQSTNMEEEEELVKKAIEQSLQTHRPGECDVGADLAQPVPSITVEEIPRAVCGGVSGDGRTPDGESLAPHGQTEPEAGGVGPTLSPLVVLEKLSDEIVRCSQGSSIVLSPEKQLSLGTRSPLRNLGTQKNRSPSHNFTACHSGVSVDSPKGSSRGMKFSLSRKLSLNKVRKELREAPSDPSVPATEPNTEPSSSSDQEPTAENPSNSEPKLQDTHSSGPLWPEQASLGPVPVSVSPAVKERRDVELRGSEQVCVQCEWPGSEPLPPPPPAPGPLRQQSGDGDGPVHYFWGIPFCPRGLDPDQYTRVILCQLETYQRCLKRAQSQLLCKLEFGPPVLPMPMPREAQRSRRVQRAWTQLTETDNQHQDAESEEEHDEEIERQTAGSPERQSSDGEESVEEAQRGSVRVEQCTEETSSQQQSSDLFIEETPEEGERANSDRGESEDSRDASSCPIVGVQQEDDVLFICAETQQSLCEDMQPESKTPQGSDNKVPAQEPEDVVLIDDDTEELPPVTKSKKACVECPLCGQRFPLEKIEVHAADCNGASDGDSESQVRTRSKPRRGAKQSDTGGSNSSTFTQ